MDREELIEKIYAISIETQESIKWIKERLEQGDRQLYNHEKRIRNTEIWIGRLKGVMATIASMITFIVCLLTFFWR